MHALFCVLLPLFSKRLFFLRCFCFVMFLCFSAVRCRSSGGVSLMLWLARRFSQPQTAALICLFFFISSAGSFSAGTTHTRHQMKALVSRLRHAKVSPFRRRASSGCQGRRHQAREKRLGESSRGCETRRLEVSDGSLCPNLKQGGKKALCIAFQHCNLQV